MACVRFTAAMAEIVLAEEAYVQQVDEIEQVVLLSFTQQDGVPEEEEEAQQDGVQEEEEEAQWDYQWVLHNGTYWTWAHDYWWSYGSWAGMSLHQAGVRAWTQWYEDHMRFDM